MNLGQEDQDNVLDKLFKEWGDVNSVKGYHKT